MARLEWPGHLSAAQEASLGLYLEMLTAWGKAFNLSGARDPAGAAALAADSFHLAAFLDSPAFAGLPEDAKIWDLGAGAGLPGIPLRILWSKGEYTLIEPREKRALFLANVLARLELPDTVVFRGRAEDFLEKRGPEARLIISRAFRPWQKLLPLARPMLAEGGQLVIMASEPPPSPPGWEISGELRYESRGAPRWLWAAGPA